MPRPSLKDERRAEILAAYERCIARHGVEGATLERIAEEAGLARALIRHNVGNKDELFASFLDRYLERASADVDDLFESLPETDRIPTLLEWLFDPAYASTSEVSVTNALITAALDDRALAERLNAWSAEFVAGIDREL
ncbi:MAG: TetR/AcrR family transcriptional regulator, partial [Pseudomonadota bacterium]